MMLSESKGPHGFGIRCSDCNNHQWLSKKESEDIEKNWNEVEAFVLDYEIETKSLSELKMNVQSYNDYFVE